MFGLFKKQDKVRHQHWKNAKHPQMLKFLSCPFPDLKTPWDELEIVSLDFETSGLEPRYHQILSYGKVHIKNGAIRLKTARHELVQAERQIPEASAVIHHITDDQVSQARPLDQVLPDILDALVGKVMLVHYNKIEQGFLNAACMKLYGSPFLIPTIDTLVLAERVLTRRNHAITPNQLRLFNLREQFRLPPYKAHNALNDAMTTAEVLMVLEGEISPNTSTRLKELIL